MRRQLNTFAHCIFALIIYVLWWDKPQDVFTPSFVERSEAKETLSWAWDQGLNNKWAENEVLKGVIEKQQRANFAEWLKKSNKALAIPLGILSFIRLDFDFLLWRISCASNMTMLHIDRSLLRHHQDLETYLTSPLSIFSDNRGTDELALRLKLPIDRVQVTKLFFCIRSVNSPRQKDFQGVAQGFAVLVLANFLYGGLHALAWNAYFISRTQLILWRFSALAIMSWTFSLSITTALANNRVIPHWQKWVHQRGWAHDDIRTLLLKRPFDSWRKLPWFYQTSTFLVAFPLSLLLLAILISLIALGWGMLIGRVYLVVASFISLFNSPESIYDVSNRTGWLSYIPHIN